MVTWPRPLGEALGRLVLAGVLTIAGLATGHGPAQAQGVEELRVLTVVDYISGREIYLASGTDHGLLAGDTLPVYEGEGSAAARLGYVSIESATERRSVATFAGPEFPVDRADLLYLGIPKSLADLRLTPDPEEAPTLERADPGAPGADEVKAAGPAAPTQETSAPPRPPVEVHGRLYLDMDALRTTTRWGEGSDQETSRSFSTPTMRLLARARNLPGGVRFNTSMRLSHRTSPGDAIQPTTSMRFFQIDLEKRFEAVPVQVNLGRIHNRYDDFAGYLDGMSLHVGEGGLGGGVAVGFVPNLWNESFSSDLPTVSGFLDYERRGESAEYTGAISFRTIRPTSDLPDQTYLGLSHRLRIGDTWIRHRAQMQQRPGDSGWEVGRFNLDASVPISGGLRAHGGWRYWRAGTLFFAQGSEAPARQRGNLGMSYWVPAGGATIDVSLDRPEGDEPAQTLSTSFFLRRTPFLGLGFSGTASYWTRGDDTSVALSPEIRRDFGRAEIRSGYRFYQTEGRFGTIRHESADVTLTLSLGNGLAARVQGWLQWGEDLTGNRIFASLWKSF